MFSNDVGDNKGLRIAIVGAGIGGLTLSTAIGTLGSKSNLSVDVYEGAEVISEIGAGINCWPRTWRIMQELGLEEKLIKFLRVEDIPDDSEHVVFKVRKSDQLKGLDIRDITIKGGSVRLHRVDLQQTLLNQMTGKLHLSHRLVSFEEIGHEVRLYFSNGTSSSCDLLVGMDGIKSQVRRGFLQTQPPSESVTAVDPLVWSGTWAYRGLINTDALNEVFPRHWCLTTPMLYVGKYKHLVVYPVAHAKLINVVAMVTDPSKVDSYYDGPASTTCEQEELLLAFHSWEPEVQALLQCIKNPMKFPLRSLKPLNRYASGRVVLAGDAAHAMLPHQGAGAGQAIEDAYILANLLCHKPIKASHIPKIAEIYNLIRCPEGNRVLEASRISGLVSQLVAPGFEEVEEGDETVADEKLQALIEDLSRQWEWTWKESAEEDKKKALMLLESELI